MNPYINQVQIVEKNNSLLIFSSVGNDVIWCKFSSLTWILHEVSSKLDLRITSDADRELIERGKNVSNVYSFFELVFVLNKYKRKIIKIYKLFFFLELIKRTRISKKGKMKAQTHSIRQCIFYSQRCFVL